MSEELADDEPDQSWLDEAASRPRPWEVEGRTFEEWLDEELARERELGLPAQYERGRYLNHMAAIEWNLGFLIQAYYEIPNDERSIDFHDWVIGRMGVAERVEILKRIVEARGLQEQFGTLANDLREANKIRNALAHSIMSGNEPSGLSGISFKGAHFPWNRYTLDELIALVENLIQLNMRLSELTQAILPDSQASEDQPSPGAPS